MKNNKGFTLIEILGAIVLLGIIAVIAFATYTNSLRGFRDNYYTNLERTLATSGEEFFDDFRNYRPTSILQAEKVSIATLETKNYISKITDYNGDACESSSYVLIVKEGRDDFSYHTCLSCNKDNYSNKDNNYCDGSWLDPTRVKYALGDINDIYVYLGTTKEELEKKLTIPVSYVRELENGAQITRQGTGEAEPTILPNNIDVVNTSVVGTYVVEYEYKTEKKNARVIVYQNEAPTVSFKKEQTRITKVGSNETTAKLTETYQSNTWAQNVIVHLSSKDFLEEGVTATKFQWFKDGIWKDFCTSDPCDVKVEEEMDKTIQFRIVDSNGKISKFTDPIVMKIDHTKPKCSISIDTQIGDNDWYNTDVTIKFSNTADQNNTNGVRSGIKKSNIYVNGKELSDQYDNRNIGKLDNIIHTEDTASITYYGIVEDEAENYAVCGPVTFKRDATKPVCSLTEHAKISCTDSLSKVNRWYYSTTNKTNGAYTTVTPSSPFSVDAANKVTTSGTYYLYAKDEAGNISAVKSYNYYDVIYDKNGGTTNPTKTSDIIRKGNKADLTPTATKNGYSFIGWNTSSSATTKLNSYTVNKDTTLYAIYKECDNGYYSNNSTTCTQCPKGYRDGTTVDNKIGESSCIRNVEAGYHIASAKATTNTVCANGYYKEAHGVTYGSTSSCTICPSGYREGTLVNNKKAENTCLRNVEAGYRIASAKATTNTVCDNGYYKEAHGVTYGSTSNCTICPSGYRDGTLVANKISENVCLMNVENGKYVKKSKDSTATNCLIGEYQTSHSVTYGSTSRCITCPAGTYNDTEGNYSCNDCGKGYYCGGGSDRHGCPGGYYGKTNVVRGTNINNACNECEAGYFCAGINDRTACILGSNSEVKSTSCSACTGKTTSDNGSPSCDAECSNRANVATWKTATWNTNNTVSNLCTINTCNAGYTLVNNTCISSTPATLAISEINSGFSHYYTTDTRLYHDNNAITFKAYQHYGLVAMGHTRTIKVTSNAAGTFTVVSSDTSKVTVTSPPNGVGTTDSSNSMNIELTGVGVQSSPLPINIYFTPNAGETYGQASIVYYAVPFRWEYKDTTGRLSCHHEPECNDHPCTRCSANCGGIEVYWYQWNACGYDLNPASNPPDSYYGGASTSSSYCYCLVHQ